ncbi:MAG: hypothetical protein WCP21_02505 [Armatimonadota bacterium]
MRRLWFVPVLALLLSPVVVRAKGVTVKQGLTGSNAGKQVLTNGDLEATVGDQIVGLTPWERGYLIDADAHSGKVAARCELADLKSGQRGMTYPVALNQKQATPFTATLWSKAKDVSGTPDSHYSLYLDLTYMDGTELWGQISPFATGTHDWQKRSVTVAPEKPIKTVSFHAIFRSHTGTAWFDDFSLVVLDLPAGAGMFDGVPVAKTAPGKATFDMGWAGGGGISDKIIVLDKQGQWQTMDGGVGGLMVRDATRKSDFRRPLGTTKADSRGLHFEATDDELGLKITADYSYCAALPNGNVPVRVDGVIEDLTGTDRGVSVYAVLPAAGEKLWPDDMRTSRKIEPNQSYSVTTPVGCGANGRASLYPFGCVGENGVSAIGAPLDPPRLYRFAYDSGSGELYGVEDLGLSKDTKTPGKATFSFVLYRADNGFRGALDTYYKLFPSYFTKRNKTEGNWMAFDQISAVTNPEDFGFAFKEGTNDVGYDEAHVVLTYTYVEPASYWLAMGTLPRTPEAALKLLQDQAAQKPPNAQAAATLTSGLRNPDDSLQMTIENAPWCDGALFINNPDPAIPTTPDLPFNQSMVLWRSINSALGQAPPGTLIGGWQKWENGYVPAPGQGRSGSQAAFVDRPQVGTGQGLSQGINVRQKQAGRIIVTAWCKTEGMTGEADKDFSLYCDLTLADGKASWGHCAPFTLGTHDWEKKEVVIDVPQPVMNVSLHLLVREQHTGKVWFDDVSVAFEGSDQNLLTNGALEAKEIPAGTVDGTYIDSLEMGASQLDFDRKHWRVASAPLVFTTSDALPAEMLMFGCMDFIKQVSEKMHAEGKMIFANSVPHRFAQNVALLDLMGTETNWHSGGKWTPMLDPECNFKRAMCYQRPYLLLQNTIFQDFPVDMVEKYMARSIFYGMMPSFFSHNAADDTYWTRPEIYNRDRHLFKQYLPAAKLIAAAGWEPLTFATTGNPKVYVERWGRGDNVYYTLFNDSDQPQAYTLTVDEKKLGTKAGSLQDVIKGAAREPQGTLGPEALLVVKVGN